MSLIEFLKLIAKNIRFMTITAITMAFLVAFITRNEKKQYNSKMVINTGVVSGYTIENHKSESRVDREYTRNELENLISLALAYGTLEELSTKLLARYLMIDQPDQEWLRKESFDELSQLIPSEIRSRLVVDSSFEETYLRVAALRDSSSANPIYGVIFSDHEYFGIEQLEKSLKVAQKRTSDLLEFSYTTTDPAICRQTLLFMTDIFIRKHREIKENQSSSVLDFFREATQKSESQLRLAEDKLLDFRVENSIINYYEQTRFIANKKEDLDELFFKENMQSQATQATIQRLEAQMGNRIRISNLNANLLDKRAELSKVSEQLARFEILALDAPQASDAKVKALQVRFAELESELNDYALEAYNIDQTPDGIATQNLLSQWLKLVIEMEQTTARLAVIRERKKEFSDVYSQFAPWGSRLKKIEREIDLAEDAYLENLHSYNQARLHMQNTLMSANLKVVDPPFYPTREQGSKRVLLIAVAFLFGYILTLGTIIALEFLDTTLKRPVEAAGLIGLDLIGVFPRFPNASKNTKIDFGFIRNRATELLVQHIKLATRHQAREPKRIIVASTRTGEGKSTIAQLAVNKLRAHHKKTLYLYPEGATIPDHHPDNQSFEIDHTIFEKQGIMDLIAEDRSPEMYDYVFVEIPGLLTGQFPVDLTAQCDLSLLVCRATRTWNAADRKVLNTYREAAGENIRLVINGTPVDALESSLGELPRNRSRIRIFIKRIASFNFSKDNLA